MLSDLRTLNIDYTEIVPHIFPVFFPSSKVRDRVQNKLLNYGVETGVHYKPNHFLSLYKTASYPFPVAERVYSKLLTLPLHPALSEIQVDKIVDLIEEAVQD